jgi:hypothetical protein
MRLTGDDRHGWRLRAMIVVLWRGGLRIHEALALAEHDLDPRRGSLLVRYGKGGRRREVGMDEWGWEHLRPWLTARAELPVGPLFCIIDGPTHGRPWSGAAGPLRAPPARRAGRRPTPVRAAPAAPRARARARPRGRPAQHHSAPARARQPRHDVDLPSRHRPGGDHRRRARPPRADDVGQRRTATLSHRSQRERRRRSRFAPVEAGVSAQTSDARAARPERELASTRDRPSRASESESLGRAVLAFSGQPVVRQCSKAATGGVACPEQGGSRAAATTTPAVVRRPRSRTASRSLPPPGGRTPARAAQPTRSPGRLRPRTCARSPRARRRRAPERSRTRP